MEKIPWRRDRLPTPVFLGFLDGSAGKASSRNAGGSIPGWGRPPGGGHGNSLPYSCLKNPHGQKSPAVHGVAESGTAEPLSTAHAGGCPAAAAESLSHVRPSATPQTAVHQAPLSLGFSRQEHWSGLPLPSPMHERKSESEVAQSCPTLSDPMNCSPPGSSVHGIFPKPKLGREVGLFG